MTRTDLPPRHDIGHDAHTTTARPTRAWQSLVLTVTANVAAWGLVLACYWWFASGGYNEWDDGAIPFHNLIAQGFLAGQLHLTIKPAPELLSMPYPYDPAIYIKWRLPDAALYDGKYYLYFGPVPALIHAAIFTVTGAFPKGSVMGLIFALGTCLWTWLLLRELAERLTLRTRHPIVVTAFLICTLGGTGLTCVTMVLGHFETALANTFFVMGGSWLWYRALQDERRLPTMVAAGLFFGLAVACRAPSVAYGGGAAAALFLYDALEHRWRPRTLLRVVAFGAPYGAIVLGLLYYNYARFGSPFEFGISYMLTGLDPVLMRFAADQIPSSTLAMIGTIPRLSPYFPFVIDRPWEVIAPPHVERPMVSILLLYPMLWLVPLGVAVAWRAPRDLRIFITGATLGVLGAYAIIGTSPWVTARYTQDFGPLGTVLGVLGLFAMILGLRGRRFGRPLAIGISTVFTSVALFFGVAMGFNHLRFDHLPAHQETAYFLDALEAKVLRRIAPDFWRSTYLRGTVRSRFHGTFYPDGETMPLSVEGFPVAVRMASLFPEPREVTVHLDGQEVGTFTLTPNPGGQLIPVGIGMIGRPSVELALSIPDETVSGDQPAPGPLWPVAIDGTSPDIVGAIEALHVTVVSRAMRVDSGDVSRRRRRLLLEEMQRLIETQNATLAVLDGPLRDRSATIPTVAEAAARCTAAASMDDVAMDAYERPLSALSEHTVLIVQSEMILRLARCRVIALRG